VTSRATVDAMKLSRRRLPFLAATAAVLPIAARMASAQAYPSRPVRWLVGYAPGGGNDIVARLMGQWFSERLGQPFVIENRPGAATNIAAEAVANVMVVHPSFPAKAVPEFIAYAKANPGKINMASAGNGSAAHLAGELFSLMTGISMVHVPYRGQAPAIADLLAGQVQVLFATSPASIEYVRSDKLRALAVTTSVRAEALPDLSTVGEFVPGYEASAWYGIGAPQKTPAEIIELLNKEANAGLADPKLKVRLADLGGTLIPGSPADFGKLIADDTEKWGKVIRSANIKL
jgi:tripartite-type tricarboxylate transporter receptor subunit TctC